MDCELNYPPSKKLKTANLKVIFEEPKTKTELASDILFSMKELRQVINNITLEIRELENSLELVLD